MFCSKCGQSLIEGGKFCPNCGAPAPMLNVQPAPVIAPMPAPAAVSESVPALVSAPISEPASALEEAPAMTKALDEPAENVPEVVKEEFEEVDSKVSQTWDSEPEEDKNKEENSDEKTDEEPVPVMAASAVASPLENTAEMPAVSPENTVLNAMYGQSAPMSGFEENAEFNGYAEFPSEPQPRAPIEATPVAKKKKPHAAIAVLVSVLFGVVIFALFLASAVLSGTRDTLSESKMSEAIKKSQPLDWVVGDIVLNDAFKNDIEELLEDNKSKADIDDIEKDTTLGEFVVIVAGEDKIDEDQVEEIAEEIDAMKTIGDIVAGYERYLLENDDKEIISTNDIEEIVEESVDVVEDVCGNTVKLNTEKLEDALDDNEETIEKLNPANSLGKVGSITSTALSAAVIIGIFAFAMILVILIGVITKRISAPAITFAVCSIITGAILVVVPTIAEIAIEEIGVSFAIISGFGADFLGDTLFASFKHYGLMALASGASVIVVVVIASAIARAMRKKKANA